MPTPQVKPSEAQVRQDQKIQRVHNPREVDQERSEQPQIPEGAGPYYSSAAGTYKGRKKPGHYAVRTPPEVKQQTHRNPLTPQYLLPKQYATARELIKRPDAKQIFEVVEKNKQGASETVVEQHIRCKLCQRFATTQHLNTATHKKKFTQFWDNLSEQEKRVETQKTFHASRKLFLAYSEDGPPGTWTQIEQSFPDWRHTGIVRFCWGIENKPLRKRHGLIQETRKEDNNDQGDTVPTKEDSAVVFDGHDWVVIQDGFAWEWLNMEMVD